MSKSYKPLRRDRTNEIQALADGIGKLAQSNAVDLVMVSDIYECMVKHWDRCPDDKAKTLELLQREGIDNIIDGDPPDKVIWAYELLWDRIVNHNDPWPEDPPVQHSQAVAPSRGQKAMAVVGGVAAGYYGTQMAGRIMKDVFAPVTTLLRLFK